MTKLEHHRMLNRIRKTLLNKKWTSTINPLHIAKEEDDGMNVNTLEDDSGIDMKSPQKFTISSNKPTYSTNAKNYGIYGMFKKVLGYDVEDEEMEVPNSTSAGSQGLSGSSTFSSGSSNPMTPEPIIHVDGEGNVFKDGDIIHRAKSKFLTAKELWKKSEFEVDSQKALCYLADVSVIDAAKKDNRLCKFKDSWVIPHPTIDNAFVSSEEFAHKEKSDDQMEHWLKREALNGEVINMVLIRSRES